MKELKELQRRQRLPVSGFKEVLVKRLIAASATQSQGDNEVKQEEQE